MTLLVSLLISPAVIYLFFRYYFVGNQYFSRTNYLRFVPLVLLGSFYLLPFWGLLDYYITGSANLQYYPGPIIYWFWFGLIFVYQLATWVIVADLLKLTARFFFKDQGQITVIHTQMVLALFLILINFTGWKVYSDTNRIQTQNIELPLNNLPQSLHNFKIIHISDIQGDRYTNPKTIARYVKKINEQQADLVIFTGDLISYGTKYIEQSARELGKANAKFGIFAVVGDHDYWAGLEHIKKALNTAQIPLLQDENHEITIDSATSVLLTGLTEVYSKSVNPATVESLTNGNRAASVKIMASHQVDEHLISSAQTHNYQMLLAGHTHGGQIRVPFMGMTFSASERETNYISGLYWKDELPININNGLGFTLAPIRYNAPPNISVITLIPE